MQVTETKAEGLNREYSVVVAAADIEEKVTTRLGEISKTIKIPGFRPGKVPAKILRQKYGQSVMGEVLEGAVNEASSKTIEDNELRPAAQPKIEITKFEEGTDLEFTMAVELFPEFDLMDFKKVSLERLVVPVKDEEIDETLQRIADSNKSSEPAKSKAKKVAKGNIAVIDFVGSVDGEEFEGGKGENYNLEIGSGTFIPGFEDQLIGMKAGEEKDVEVKFPDDYGAENLKGKDAVFKCTVNEIRTVVPAELDDELAKKVGMETLDALKDAIREERSKEFDQMTRQHVKKHLLDALDEAHSFELPQTLVDGEVNQIWSQYEETRKNNPDAIDAEDKDKSDDELKTEYASIAERRVRLGLVLAEVGRVNEIELNQEDLNQAIMQEATRYPGQEQAVFEYFKNNPQAIESLRAPLFEEKVVDFILELADVTDKEVSADDLLNSLNDEEEEKPKKKAAAKKKAPAKKKAAAKEEEASE
ncbi:trigger factor [Terasakiella sp. SH-1]|uniref:trigger factor n=1 Tax=Terasakiella sp. SH-1 TaxID=2560057 RepID=UPI001073938D|nr:trigger factor [Terasakiella sp. SH-1]